METKRGRIERVQKTHEEFAENPRNKGGGLMRGMPLCGIIDIRKARAMR